MQQDSTSFKQVGPGTGMNTAGFNLLESMIALALLASIILSVILFNTGNSRTKDAKILSRQTEAFAVTYAKYMKNNYKQIDTAASTAPYVLTPEVLDKSGNWPIDLTHANMYRQKPCVIIIKNKITNNLEAVMYYVGGPFNLDSRQIDIMQEASVELGGKGGILINDNIMGNSGWTITANSPFLSNAIKCGAPIINNSVAINIDLLSNWNQNVQQIQSLLRGKDNTPGVMSLPGHVKNSNTLKTNLYFTQGNGVVLENAAPIDPIKKAAIKLSVAYNGRGTGAATLGLGNKTAAIVGDTFQPDLLFTSGDPCNDEEEGKTVGDKGINNVANQFLSRSTLVCTENKMLCPKSDYCYLPSTSNKIIFQNTVAGIQDSNNEFICPQSVPFALNVQTSLTGGNQIFVMANTGTGISPNTISATLSKFNSNSKFTQMLNCPTSGCSPRILAYYNNLASFLNSSLGQLESVDLGTITGDPVAISSSGGNPEYSPINSKIGKFVTTVGYKITNSCNAACGHVSDQLGKSWQILGTNRSLKKQVGVDIKNSQLGCACERVDLDNLGEGYMGIAAVIGPMQPLIISVTCSNMPLYYSQ